VVLSLQKKLRLEPKNICLISGAPRSGTTAVSRWLGQQRSTLSFQESRILVSAHRFMEETSRFINLANDRELIIGLARRLVIDYYAAANVLLRKRLLVDKEPLDLIAFPLQEYAQFLLNVRKMFPDSKFLLTIRDPVATVWSMTRRTWGTSLACAESRNFTLEQYLDIWCSAADLILQYCTDPNTYIVQFGRLVHNPERESKHICVFLDIHKGSPFRPRSTDRVDFSPAELEKIWQAVRPRLDQLHAMGISELQ
jgi:hypothetical protein